MSSFVPTPSHFDFFGLLSFVLGVTFKPSAKKENNSDEFSVGTVILDTIEQKLFVVSDHGLAVSANQRLSHKGSGYWLAQPDLAVVISWRPHNGEIVMVSVQTEESEIVEVLWDAAGVELGLNNKNSRL